MKTVQNSVEETKDKESQGIFITKSRQYLFNTDEWLEK
jgi:hypothetical protein